MTVRSSDINAAEGSDAVAASSSAPSRRMTRAKLIGQHEHETEAGQKVQIWTRDGRYLARGRLVGRQFGETLGRDEKAAGHQLRRLLTELEDGTFVPAKARGKRKTPGLVPRHDVRGLIDTFLNEHRRVKGQNSADTYASRLRHVLDFAERAENRRRWPKAADIDRAFAVELRSCLVARDVTRNGHPGGMLRKMAPKMVRLCLEAIRAVVCWGRRADVRQLPPEFVNPFTAEVVGPKPTKNPLRSNPLPLETQIRLVHQMDE